MADKKWTQFPVAETPVSGSDVVVGLQLRSTESDQQNVQYTFDDIATYVLSQDSNTGGGGGNAFGTIAVSGQSDVVADSASDTLTLVAGSNVTLTTSAGGDSVTIAASGGSGGAIVQVKNVVTGATASGTTTIPIDDTIPQNTEGNEFMTLAITPTSATNKLKIDVCIILSTTATAPWYMAAALFQDSTANALACAVDVCNATDGSITMNFSYVMTAGTTSATTFKVRAGGNGAGTTRINGRAGARIYGGVLASSITITEYVP